MSCCREEPEVVAASEATPPFDGMECVTVYPAHFASLRRCGVCGQLWVVDAWDRYARLAAFKVEEIPEPHVIEPLQERAYDRLAESDAGGLSAQQCLWSGCGNMALRGMKVCGHHARLSQ